MKMKALLVSALALLAGAGSVMAQDTEQIAFPGAEGFGRYTTGGRGGKVIHVTTLEDGEQEGTFRYACNQSATRTIVFDVSGTIHLTKELKLGKGNVTIAGQTAPGDGICVADYPFVISANNVIIRFMRFRLGNKEVAHHEGDALGGMDKSNIIVDHCSISWSIDECLSVYGMKNHTVQWCIAAQSLKNSGHSKGSHGYGGNWGGAGATYHHNLLAHHESRTPRLGPRPSTQTDERMDMRNNVIYNWAGNGCYGGEGMNVNIVNNYYKAGPATFTVGKAKQQRIAALGIRTVDYCLNKESIARNYNAVKGTSYTKSNISGSYSDGKYYVKCGATKYEINMDDNTIDVDGNSVKVIWNDWKKMLHVWAKLYVDGNYFYNEKNPSYAEEVNADQFKVGVSNQIDNAGNDRTYPGDDQVKLESPIAFESVTTHTAEKAYEKVLAYAGASLHRDWFDEQMVSDTRDGVATATGSNNNPGIVNSQDDNKPEGAGDDWSAWPLLQTDTSIDITDTDGDGMPDWWEDQNGLDKNDAEDGAALCDDGYTNLEHYMNGLVQHIMDAGNEDGNVLAAIEPVVSAGTMSQTIPAVYTIYGVKVGDVADTDVYSLPKGLYIVNGKKIAVK